MVPSDSMDAPLLALVVVIALLLAHIWSLNRRITDMTTSQLAASERREQYAVNAAVTAGREHDVRLTSTVSTIQAAVSEQVGVMKDAVKVAWAPSPPPQSAMQDQVQQIMQKYNLPRVRDETTHDLWEDPTDRWLPPGDDGMPPHMGAMILPRDDDDYENPENPTGIPGFKPAWSGM